ncbi:MAG: MarR family EPS-associated transcriptional regulator [Rhodocyclaceae bacterium]|nr:MarR family EPS-associated transcriptional regulator [Rhodocyclaceae bacterium]MCL4759244.1 MarR family EPS-associated transcriptional regulator [Rhodocyclaceae bacterium]
MHDELRYRILKRLEANPAISQRELADALGVSLGRANYCLRALIEKGLVKVDNFRRSDNKLAYAYLLTPAGFADKALVTRRFLQRKLAEYDDLKAEIEALRKEVGSDRAESRTSAI